MFHTMVSLREVGAPVKRTLAGYPQLDKQQLFDMMTL
jgi:hypothetical protein